MFCEGLLDDLLSEHFVALIEKKVKDKLCVPQPLQNQFKQRMKTCAKIESNNYLSKKYVFSTVIIPVSASAFIPPQAEMLTEVRKEILTFHHEGFFWRCWFFGEGHPETIWTFWYSEYDATTPHLQHLLAV